MSRYVAAFTLVVMAAMATAGSWCVLCDPRPAETAQAERCHGGAASSGDSVTAAHDCSDHAAAEIVATARTEPALEFRGDLQSGVVVSLTTVDDIAIRCARACVAGPPPPATVPLRI